MQPHIALIVVDEGPSLHFDYAIPSHLQNQILVGSRVKVSFRKKEMLGTVVGLSCQTNLSTLQTLLSLEQQSFLSENQIKLAHWISQYYAAPLAKVMQCFVPAHVRHDKETQKLWFIEPLFADAGSIDKEDELFPLIKRLLKYPKGVFLSELLKSKTVSTPMVEKAEKRNLISLQKMDMEDFLFHKAQFCLSPPLALNEEQQKAFDDLAKRIDAKDFSVTLLHGITGSGKTEVYLQAIAKTRSLGKSVLILVPEVSLTSQTIERLRCRFPERIALLHHKMSFGERLKYWRALSEGSVHIAVGARSAIFAPMPSLGLIIIDEEHEHAYKQSEEEPCYHARDVAIMRAKIEKCPIILGSATPSFESYKNSLDGKYHLAVLSQRASHAQRPHATLIDMVLEKDRHQGKFPLLSTPLLNAIEKRLARGEQTLILLNRRGYWSLITCKGCQESVKCLHCDLGLTYHRKEHLLRCHLCGYTQDPAAPCRRCGSVEPSELKGPGTEMVERALCAIFKGATTLRMDRDTTRGKHSHEEILNAFKTGRADILIGTQMIAKGLHLPMVTLVGVLSADTALQIPEFRGPEQLFSLIAQVAGRAGRELLAGEVMIQTALPHHPLFTLASEEKFASFYHSQIQEREEFQYPPFVRMAKCLITAESLEEALECALLFHKLLKKNLPPSVTFYPIQPCAHTKIKDRHRVQFLMKADRKLALSPLLLEARQSFTLPRSISLLIDVDPIKTMD